VNLSDAVPSLWTILWQLAFCMLTEDAFGYWSHRLLHHRFFYKLIHKVHHQYKKPTGICAEYAHPVEYMLGNSISFATGPLILRPHPIVFWAWALWRIGETVEAHSGYEISQLSWGCKAALKLFGLFA